MAVTFAVAAGVCSAITRNTGIVPASSDYTLRFRYRHLADAGGGYNVLFALIDSVAEYDDGVMAFTYGSSILALEAFIGGPDVDTPVEVTLVPGTTYTVAYVRRGTTHRLYLDRLLCGSLTGDYAAITFGELWMGGDTFADVLTGPIWDVMEFPSALTVADLAELEEGRAGLGSTRGGAWTDTPLQTALRDLSGRGHDWTASGAVQFVTNPDVQVAAAEFYSDQHLHDPSDYFGGYKDARVVEGGWGIAERRLSDRYTGAWSGSQFTVTLSDKDARFRQRHARQVALQERWWSGTIPIRMTTRDNRKEKGTPYVVFNGPIVSARPVDPMSYELTLGDVISQRLLADKSAKTPWRMIGDGFIEELTTLAEGLDKTTPEPIIYGEHRRLYSDDPDEHTDPPSQHGLAFPPIYLGTETLTDAYAGEWHVWLIAGHAVADVRDVLVNRSTIVPDEGTEWLIPHHTGYDTFFGAPYQDRRSKTYENDRRYTLLYGKVTDLAAEGDDLTDPDACALGERELLVFIDGVEPVGDGSGTVIVDIFQQWKHFAINYVAYQGQNSYQSGAWLTNPSWTLFDQTVPIIDTASFDACTAIGATRLDAFDEHPPGYRGAAIIGSRAGDRRSLLDVMADFARSSGAQWGFTNLGRLRACLLNPTEAIEAAAELYTDATEILRDTFETNPLFDQQANRIPFVGDYDHVSANFLTTGTAAADAAVTYYGRDIDAEAREYPYAPGITMLYHLARLEALVRQHAPRYVTLEATIGPDVDNRSLGYADLGEYIRYRHYGAIGGRAEMRLGQIVSHQVQVEQRTVRVEVLDCEDLLGFADPPAAVDPGTNDSCATATAITNGPDEPYIAELDTTDHADDATAGLLPDDRTAWGAAYFTLTPSIDGTLFITTAGSDFDTQLAVFTGDCGSLTRIQYNDNDGLLMTSILEFAVTASVPVTVLVCGFAEHDRGVLRFGLQLVTPP